MKRVEARKPVNPVRPHPPKVEAEVESGPTPSPSSPETPQVPSNSRVPRQPSRGAKGSDFKSKVSSKKKKKTEVISRKRKIKTQLEKDGGEEPLRDTKKFRGEMNQDSSESTDAKDQPNLSFEVDSSDLKTGFSPAGEAGTDNQNQVESQVEHAAMMPDEAEEGEITNESSASTEPSQSEKEIVKEKLPKRGKDRTRSNQVRPRPPNSQKKTSSGTDGDEEIQRGTTEIRRSGRVRQPRRDNEDCWIYV